MDQVKSIKNVAIVVAGGSGTRDGTGHTKTVH